MPSLLQDLRYGVRTLVRTPGFSLIAIAILALGIGANATVFSLANAFFLRPLPVPNPESVVRVYSNRYSNTRHRAFLEYRDRSSTLAGLAGFQIRSFGLRVDRETEHVFGEIVSGDYFPVLGIVPAHGRLLLPSDDRAGASPVVVISHAFWKRRFGGSPETVGRTIGLNDQRFVIVGIAGQRFTGVLAPLAGDLWVPLSADLALRPAIEPEARLRGTTLHLIGRLKPGVDRARAQADLDAIGQQLRAGAGEAGRGPAVTVYGATMLHPEVSTPVTAFTAVLMVLVALVLLIVSVNLANLVLARAAGREVELAVRQSLGAGRTRVIRQMLTENLLLSIAGAAGGLAIAYWSTQLAMATPLPVPVPVALDLSLDVRVLAFTAISAIVATLAIGAVPALTASKVDLVGALKGMGGDGPRHSRLRSAFLVAQVSMSVLLLIAAGLFIRSFRHAKWMDTGFSSEQVLTASVDLETRGYSESRGREFAQTLVERLVVGPDILAANLVDIVPLTLSNTTTYRLRDGDPLPTAEQPPVTPQIYENIVGPGHFDTLQIPIVAGRDFTHQDTAAAQGVAIVNETLARTFWPGKSAVGQRLLPVLPGEGRHILEVVGVVRDSKYVSVGESSRPFLYRPLAQNYTPRMTIMVRTAGAPGSALPVIKDVVRTLDPGLAVFNVATLEEASSISILPARVAGFLLAGLGVLALALAALGIYGVLSFIVRARTRDIGVRVAIGASPHAVAKMVVRQAMTWTLAGAVIGLAGALVLSRFLESFLYGVSPIDPLTYGGVTAIIGVVACAAAIVPAVRASRLDPIVALRNL